MVANCYGSSLQLSMETMTRNNVLSEDPLQTKTDSKENSPENGDVTKPISPSSTDKSDELQRDNSLSSIETNTNNNNEKKILEDVGLVTPSDPLANVNSHVESDNQDNEDTESTNSSHLSDSRFKLQLEDSRDTDADDPDEVSDGAENGNRSNKDLVASDPLSVPDSESSLDKTPSFADVCKNLEQKNLDSRKRTINDIIDKDVPIEDNKKLKLDTEQKKLPVVNGISIISSHQDYPKLENSKISEMKGLELEKFKLKSKEKLVKISRQELEDLFIEIFAEKVLYNHELGELRDLRRKLEATLENHRKKAAQFHKEIEDLGRVTHKLQLDHETKKSQMSLPMKVKRTVGIQVNPTIISKGLLNQPIIEKPFAPPPVLKPASTETPDTNQSQETTPTQNGPTGKTGVIDLTDDDEGKAVANTLVAPKPPMVGMVAIPRPALNIANPPQGQLVALNTQGSMSRLLLVPTSVGAPSTALLMHTPKTVANIGNNAPGCLSVPASISPITPGVNVVSQPPVNGYIAIPKTSMALTKVAPIQPRPVTIVPSTTTTPSTVVSQPRVNGSTNAKSTSSKHPAPLPVTPVQQIVGSSKPLPPQPILNLSHRDNSIVLLWKMSKSDDNYETISSYQLYAYQEGTAPPVASLWTKVGSVKALDLPMACTLTQFRPGHTYHFAVRAVDARTRLGPFSDPKSIRLGD